MPRLGTSICARARMRMRDRLRGWGWVYAGQEATVRTGHGTTDWFQIGKGVRQGCILSPFLFNLYAEYIMRNAGLEEAQTGIKIVGRNINNLRYADDITLMPTPSLAGDRACACERAHRSMCPNGASSLLAWTGGGSMPGSGTAEP